jgi:nitrite reductase/ring-hydroxylating ferredoxin subunit
MGPACARLIDELGYDPGDGLPELADAAAARRLGRGLARGAIVAARVAGQPVAVARLGSGRLVVVTDACPHDGGRISDGFVDGERLVCARHGWELEARDGRCERACKLRE